MIATVDLYDTDPVMDSYMDRLVDFRIERLPLDVLVYRTPERRMEVREEQRKWQSQKQENLRPAG